MVRIRSSRVVVDGTVRPATIGFETGVITEISSGVADLDYGDRVILPGLVDSHVHVNEPGRSEWEGFASATRAAAAGGTTTIVDMPLNSIPPTVTTEALRVKRSAAVGKLTVDVGFWGGLIPGSGAEISSLVSDGVCGFKSFLVDSGVDEFPAVSLTDLEEGLVQMAALGVPSLLHAEDPASILQIQGDARSYRSYLESRPATGEGSAVGSAARLAADTGAQVHILHVSSADAVEELARGPASLTGETCPHYLIFCADDIEDGATAFKCAPPIRDSNHRDRLWEGLQDRTLAMVVSDHSPAPADLKELQTGDFARAWGGVGSLQLRLQAVWTGASRRGLGIENLAAWLAAKPAELAGLGSKGAIEVGKDADFVVFDPDDSTKVRGRSLEHRHPITPYDGMTLRGSVITTILRGETVFDRGALTTGSGRMLVRDG
ncbi:MAG: allantoinase AllB [Acidimicrobiia bacterium]|nr:allantoinase AllB [Acidimicrobiia bacterium]MDH3462606.1 allantoinase AllB [Acidimicrobiia bacterium]